MFEDVLHERSLFLLLSLRDPDLIKQSKFTDHEINKMKIQALEKLHRQKCSKKILPYNYYDSNCCIIKEYNFKFE